jgi:predicted nucleotidyltransferase
MPTAAQQSLIEAITRALERDSRVESAWLSGSLGRGAGDEFSDVDIVAVVQGDPSATCTEYRDRLGEIAETVLARILLAAR